MSSWVAFHSLSMKRADHFWAMIMILHQPSSFQVKLTKLYPKQSKGEKKQWGEGRWAEF